MKGSLTLITPPTEEPITIEQAEFDIRDIPNEDVPNVRSLIIAARQRVETHLKRQIITATYDYTLDYFPGWEIELPKPPLQSVTSITYLDTGGVTRTVSPSSYLVDSYTEPGRVTPTWDQIWPSTRDQNAAVAIRFVCGYGQADSVPESIKRAISYIAAQMYNGCIDDGSLNQVLNGILCSEVWGCYA